MAAQTNYTLLETDEYEFDPEMGSMDTPSIAETQFKSGVLEEVQEYTRREKLANGVAFMHVPLMGSLLIFGAAVPAAAILGVGGLVLSPMVAYVQREMVDIITLNEVCDNLNEQVDDFEKANKELRKEIDRLTGTANRLEDTTAALEQIHELQGKTLDEYVEQIDKSRDNSDRLKFIVMDKFTSMITQSLIEGDKDGNCKINENEGKQIIEYMEDLLGLEINDDEFMDVVRRKSNIFDFEASIRNNHDKIFNLAKMYPDSS